jgi:hypothetical protein
MNPEILVDVDATDEPITLAEAYHQLRIDSDAEIPNDYAGESLVRLQMKGAREVCELYAGISFGFKRLKYVLTCFPRDRFGRLCAPIELPFGPLVEVVSFKYGEELLTPDYYVVKEKNLLVPRLTWPYVNYTEEQRIEIIYDAGYGNNSNTKVCPSLAKVAMLYVLGHFDANREDVTDKQMYEIPQGSKDLLDNLRERHGAV